MIINASRLSPFGSALLQYLAPALTASLLCAVLTTFLVHIGESFNVNFLLAASISMTATLIGTGSRLLLWKRGALTGGFSLRSSLTLIVMLTLLAPLSFVIGKLFAYQMLGKAQEPFTLHQPDTITGILVLSLLACAACIICYCKRERAVAQQQREILLEKQSAQVRLQMLQAQIEPHLLFDTLTTLQTLVSSEPLRAQQMINQLVQYLKATLSASREELTTLGQEMHLLSVYLGLMSLRMGLRLTYRLQVPEELQRLRIAPMLLQPLVENAIRHGLEPKADGGDCTVRVIRHEDVLVISVFDTGKGLRTLVSYNRPDSTHPGLEGIRARLETRYGPLAELTLTHNIPEGTVAQITLPMHALHKRS